MAEMCSAFGAREGRQCRGTNLALGIPSLPSSDGSVSLLFLAETGGGPGPGALPLPLGGGGPGAGAFPFPLGPPPVETLVDDDGGGALAIGGSASGALANFTSASLSHVGSPAVEAMAHCPEAAVSPPTTPRASWPEFPALYWRSHSAGTSATRARSASSFAKRLGGALTCFACGTFASGLSHGMSTASTALSLSTSGVLTSSAALRACSSGASTDVDCPPGSSHWVPSLKGGCAVASQASSRGALSAAACMSLGCTESVGPLLAHLLCTQAKRSLTLATSAHLRSKSSAETAGASGGAAAAAAVAAAAAAGAATANAATTIAPATSMVWACPPTSAPAQDSIDRFLWICMTRS
mmetsp:Transcript_108596/g.273200  ORF Transcript_108596/g.273200 Transcript_108596/m.273200 type:complete len:354 (+) Transcript_108596:2818-3879(+)